MAYKPVPTTQKICAHCNTLYYAKDKRRLYCSSSCNTLAWMTRHGLGGHDQEPKAKKAAGELETSLNNILTIAGGVLVADTAKAGLNAVFDVQPTNAEIMEELKALRSENARLAGYLAGKVDVVGAITTDVRAGVGAGSPNSHNAIMISEQKRKGLPSPSETQQDNRGITIAGR